MRTLTTVQEGSDSREFSSSAPRNPATFAPMSDDRGARLAALIEDDPDDDEAYRAYGDWLEEQGDPRSQLMGMHVLHDRLTDGLQIDRTKVEHLEARLTAFFEQHRDHFLGSLAKTMPKPTDARQRRDAAPKLQWRRGFIYKAELTRVPRIKMDKFLDRLLALPSARFLVELQAGWAEDPIALVRVIAARAPRSLRRLEIGAHAADLSAMWPALSRLHELTVIGAATYGAIDLPALRRLHIGSCTDKQDLILGLARGSLPSLRTLVLDFRPYLESVLAGLAGTTLAQQLESLELEDVALVSGTPLARIAKTIER
jgi:uncharacterized protein (TIGR02996 family)